MEFMIAWYPALRFSISALVVIFIVYLGYKEYYKPAGVFIILVALFMYLSPVKIDGTNSSSAHRYEDNQRALEYKAVQLDAIQVVEKKLTFQERMDAEAKRSKLANKEIENEMLK